MVDLPAMSLAMHAAEDLLGALDSGKREVTADLISATLDCLDQVSDWVAEFDAHQALSADAGEKARAIAERLRSFLANSRSARRTRLGRNSGLDFQAACRNDRQLCVELWAISYEPREDCFFNGDDPVALMRKLPNLLALDIEPRNPWPNADLLDPYACNLRLRAICGAPRAEFEHLFRTIPDQVRFFDITHLAASPRQRQ